VVSELHDEASRESAAPPDLSVQQMADRVASLLAGFDSVSTPRQAREGAEALVQTILGLYGNGLERVLEIVHETAGNRSDDFFEKFVADPLVEGLMCLHGLHPVSVEDRVGLALDSVRPYLKSHEGGVAIAGIEGDVVLLQLEGSCDGCPSSTATVKLAVEKAILERVPEIREVRAIGLAAPSLGASNGHATLKIESDWIELAELDGLRASEEAGLHGRQVSGTPVVFVRFGETVYAYRNACPQCSQRLDDALLRRPLLTCAGCAGSFDVIHAGRAGTPSGSAAQPFPLACENGRVRITIPLGT